MANSRKETATSCKEVPKKSNPIPKPVSTVRQGNLKVVLWRNQGEN